MSAKRRVEIEEEALQKRVSKLTDFIICGDYRNLSTRHRELLLDQLMYMKKYLAILEERLVIWEE